MVCEYANFGPYKIWYADLWKCPNCKNEIIVGFGCAPVAEHFQKDFQYWLKKVEYIIVIRIEDEPRLYCDRADAYLAEDMFTEVRGKCDF